MTTVLHLLPGLGRVGAELDTFRLALAGLAAGQRVLIASAPGPLVQPFLAAGGEHLAWTVGRRHPSSLRWIAALRTLCLRETIDIIHAQSRLPAWWAWCAWRTLPRWRRPRLVTTVHGCYHVSPYSAIMLRGDLAIAVSHFVAADLRRDYPQHDHARVVAVPRGIDPADFPPGYRPTSAWRDAFDREHPRAAGAFRLGLVARVVRGKGHADLLDALALLRQRGLRPQAVCVGGFDPRHPQVSADLLARCTRLGLDDQVTWTGERADVRDCMAHCHAVLCLSRHPESFGLAALEAASLGRPVIAWRHGGSAEVLDAIQPEGLVPLGDLAALAERIATLMQGAAWPTDRAHPYTVQRCAAATWAAYDRVLAAEPRHP